MAIGGKALGEVESSFLSKVLGRFFGSSENAGTREADRVFARAMAYQAEADGIKAMSAGQRGVLHTAEAKAAPAIDEILRNSGKTTQAVEKVETTMQNLSEKEVSRLRKFHEKSPKDVESALGLLEKQGKAPSVEQLDKITKPRNTMARYPKSTAISVAGIGSVGLVGGAYEYLKHSGQTHYFHKKNLNGKFDIYNDSNSPEPLVKNIESDEQAAKIEKEVNDYHENASEAVANIVKNNPWKTFLCGLTIYIAEKCGFDKAGGTIIGWFFGGLLGALAGSGAGACFDKIAKVGSFGLMAAGAASGLGINGPMDLAVDIISGRKPLSLEAMELDKATEAYKKQEQTKKESISNHKFSSNESKTIAGVIAVVSKAAPKVDNNILASIMAISPALSLGERVKSRDTGKETGLIV